MCARQTLMQGFPTNEGELTSAINVVGQLQERLQVRLALGGVLAPTAVPSTPFNLRVGPEAPRRAAGPARHSANDHTPRGSA